MLAEIKESQNHPSAEEATGAISLLDLAEILDQHKIWVETGGESGVKADLCGVNLSRSDLTGVNLEGAFIQRANLIGADLSMANLRGASLVQADLREANLLGTELRGANLMGANLYGAEGLWVGRLGGTNLFDAILPETIATFDSTKAISDASKVARWFYFLILGASLACIALIGLTTDVRLIVDASAIPFARFPKVISMTSFYLGAPLVLFILYLRFHFLLLRLWGSMAGLPAVFKDGQTLEKDGPWYLMGLVRRHFRWMREGRSPFLGSRDGGGDGARVLGGAGDAVFILVAVFGAAGFSRNTSSRVSVDAFSSRGNVCSDNCRARAAAGRSPSPEIEKSLTVEFRNRASGSADWLRTADFLARSEPRIAFGPEYRDAVFAGECAAVDVRSDAIDRLQALCGVDGGHPIRPSAARKLGRRCSRVGTRSEIKRNEFAFRESLSSLPREREIMAREFGRSLSFRVGHARSQFARSRFTRRNFRSRARGKNSDGVRGRETREFHGSGFAGRRSFLCDARERRDVQRQAGRRFVLCGKFSQRSIVTR